MNLINTHITAALVLLTSTLVSAQDRRATFDDYFERQRPTRIEDEVGGLSFPDMVGDKKRFQLDAAIFNDIINGVLAGENNDTGDTFRERLRASLIGEKGTISLNSYGRLNFDKFNVTNPDGTVTEKTTFVELVDFDLRFDRRTNHAGESWNILIGGRYIGNKETGSILSPQTHAKWFHGAGLGSDPLDTQSGSTTEWCFRVGGGWAKQLESDNGRWYCRGALDGELIAPSDFEGPEWKQSNLRAELMGGFAIIPGAEGIPILAIEPSLSGMRRLDWQGDSRLSGDLVARFKLGGSLQTIFIGLEKPWEVPTDLPVDGPDLDLNSDHDWIAKIGGIFRF